MEIRFEKEPTFAELWDICVNERLYRRSDYVQDVVELLRRGGYKKILDTCAGGGFISLDLRREGFEIECMDLMDDQIEVFKKNSRYLGVSEKIKKLSWSEALFEYPSGSFDFLFCRGNSFIYADGGWNRENLVDKQRSLASYETTLKIFYDLLGPGGTLYIDKFHDDEESHEEQFVNLNVSGDKRDLVFHVQRSSEGWRRAGLSMKRAEGEMSGTINKTYDLKESELEELMKRVGFRNVRKISIASEKNFAVWLADK